jgi:hypothetical protein
MPNTDEPITAEYQRPMQATLVVQLDSGEEFPATAEDLDRFRLVSRLSAYITVKKSLERALATNLNGRDLTEAQLNPIRHVIEIALLHPEILEDAEMQETFDAVAGIEQILQEYDPEAPRQ